ncbi:hypothetical protein C6A85_000000105200 [Mycobacterium sp. ITM-2017-0098]|nr:hypothetical protein C6A85_000000105200 [Mycobacterium sp. ITM-2017-0098]
MGDARGAVTFLAEWFLRDLAERTVDDIVKRLDAAASVITAGGTPVRLVATLSVPTDEVLYGVFDASSPEAVVATCLRAGLPHQRLSTDVVARFVSGAA